MPVRTGDVGRETEAYASNTVGHVELLPSSGPLSILGKTKEGEALLASGTVTKVVTTHVSTKITTTKMAIGDDSSIGRIVATNGMAIEPQLQLTFDENEDPTRRPRSPPAGPDDDHGRKVSFPQDALSSRASTGTAGTNAAYSGRLLKNGFRLFKTNWHPVDLTLMRDGTLEWTNVDDKNHSHKVQLKDLPLGCVVLGKTCLGIPTYQSPKLGKSLVSDRLIAIGKPKKGKMKSYWFLAESDEEMDKLRHAFIHILGTSISDLGENEVRKVWTGQKDVPVVKTPEVRLVPPTGVEAVANPKRGSLVAPRASLLAPIDDDESPGTEEVVTETSTVIKQRPDSKIIAEELLHSQTSRQVEPPRRKGLSPKEAFFAHSP